MRRLQNKGFTIVELMIVFAVAGMIFLLIFNAIPILIRNGHNNQRRQDVNVVLSAISQYQLRHSGNFPPDYGALTAVASGVGPLKLSFYNSTSAPAPVITPGGAGGLAITSVTVDNVSVRNYYLCKPDGSGAVSAAAGYRDIVAIYDIETSNATAVKCQQL